MSMCLIRISDGEYFRWLNISWYALLELAYNNNWQPQGTKLYYDDEPYSVSESWNGTYFTNDEQTITSEDAKNLADALERALPDIPDEDAIAHKKEIIAMPDCSIMESITSDVWRSMNVFEKLSGLKNYIIEFIEFLRGGACIIT